jgi:hypothetical protein
MSRTKQLTAAYPLNPHQWADGLELEPAYATLVKSYLRIRAQAIIGRKEKPHGKNKV